MILRGVDHRPDGCDGRKGNELGTTKQLYYTLGRKPAHAGREPDSGHTRFGWGSPDQSDQRLATNPCVSD